MNLSESTRCLRRKGISVRVAGGGELAPYAQVAWTKRYDESGKFNHVAPEVSTRDGRHEEESNYGLA